MDQLERGKRDHPESAPSIASCEAHLSASFGRIDEAINHSDTPEEEPDRWRADCVDYCGALRIWIEF